MSMRCNLLGHSYGNEEVNTTSDGGEVGDIKIHKRVRVCERCDHEEVISENTSVRVSPDGESVSDVTDEETKNGTLNHGGGSDINDAIIIGKENTAANDKAKSEEPADENSHGTVSSSEGGAFKDSEVRMDGSAAKENDKSDVVGLDSPTTSDGATIITDTSTDSTVENTDVADELSSSSNPTGEREDDVSDDTSKVSNGDDAIVWSGESNSPGTAQTPDTSGNATAVKPNRSRGEQHRNHQTERKGTRLVREGGRDVMCPDCSFRQNQHEANMMAGDACPGCQEAYLNWADTGE